MLPYSQETKTLAFLVGLLSSPLSSLDPKTHSTSLSSSIFAKKETEADNRLAGHIYVRRERWWRGKYTEFFEPKGLHSRSGPQG